MYEFGVFIGRFEPFHKTHLASVKYALQQCGVLVIILGSTNQARNVKNPWTAAERERMIRASLSESELRRVQIVHGRDFLYNDNLWIANTQRQVADAMEEYLNEHGRVIKVTPDVTLTVGKGPEFGEPYEVALFGHKKDASSFYLKLFPQWDFKETGIVSPLNATDIRERYFRQDVSYLDDVPFGTATVMEEFKTTVEFKRLQDEFHHVVEYRKSWEGAPFPPVFVTVDAVVIKSGHILVVRRRGSPGKGLIALPGGFLNQNERIRDGALRELKEETGIKIPIPDLKDAICDSEVFDHPGRSLRGRTITHAFCVNLGHGELPQVKGSDDADKAWWVPLNEVDSRDKEFFEDHYHVIKYFTSRF